MTQLKAQLLGGLTEHAFKEAIMVTIRNMIEIVVHATAGFEPWTTRVVQCSA